MKGYLVFWIPEHYYFRNPVFQELSPMAAKTPRKSPPAKPQSEQHLMLENAVGQIEKMFGKGSIMKLDATEQVGGFPGISAGAL